MTQLNPEFRRSLAERFAAIRTLKPASLIGESERWRNSVEVLKTGSFFRLEGKTYQVLEAGFYRETNDNHSKDLGYSWPEFKLFCVETGEISYLEWEKDDKILIYLTIQELKFSNLRDEEGAQIDEDDLAQISTEEDDVLFQGKVFEYDDDCAAKYFRSQADTKGERLWLYEFEAADGTCLTIEEWPDGDKEDYQIFLSRPIRPEAIEILSEG